MKTTMLTWILSSLFLRAFGQPETVKSPCEFKPPYKIEYWCNQNSSSKNFNMFNPLVFPYGSQVIARDPFVTKRIPIFENKNNIAKHKTPLIGKK